MFQLPDGSPFDINNGADVPGHFELRTDSGYRESLCPESEDIMLDAIERDLVFLVNDSILFKYLGYTVGVPLQTIETPNGILTPGHWYNFDYLPRENPGNSVTDMFRGIFSWNRSISRIHIPGVSWLVECRPVLERNCRGFTIEDLYQSVHEAADIALAQNAITLDNPYG